MDSSQILVILILLIPLALVALDRLRIDMAALLIALALGAAQFFGLGMLGPAGRPTDAAQAITGFGQPAVLTLLALFILTRGLEKSGLTRWLAGYLVRIGGKSEVKQIAIFAGATALLSLFMNNLAAGALVLPSAMETSRRTGIKPSKLLIPVAYGSLLGGAATYFTTANIIVSNLLTIANPPQAPLSVLDFTPTGGLIALAGILYLALLGQRLLPDRAPAAEHLAVRPTGTELERYYQLDERLWEARVQPGSPLVGKTLRESEIGERLGVAVAAIWRGAQAVFAPPPQQVLEAGEVLLLVGREERVAPLGEQGLAISRGDVAVPISQQGVSFVEIMPAPHSPVLGKTLREIGFRTATGFTAVALWRGSRSYRTNVADFPLALGDTLLLIGAPKRLRQLQRDPDFIVLETNPNDRPVDRRQAWVTGGAVLAGITASILGFPVYLAMLAAALFILLAGVLSMEEAYRAIEWQAIFLIAGMYTISLALVQTGLAELLGRSMVTLARPFGDLGLAAGAYLLTTLLTQVMGGQVAALVTGPVAISAALSLGANPQPIAVATAIGCSASFITPMAHPVNILMIAPANYRFKDFFKVGWPLTLLSFVMLLLGMVLFWKL